MKNRYVYKPETHIEIKYFNTIQVLKLQIADLQKKIHEQNKKLTEYETEVYREAKVISINEGKVAREKAEKNDVLKRARKAEAELESLKQGIHIKHRRPK